jgi:hypothetical protein
MNKNLIKFILFCIGIATAMAASIVFLLILCLNFGQVRVVAFENNPLIAGLEIVLLINGIATCAAASEIYYRRVMSKDE